MVNRRRRVIGRWAGLHSDGGTTTCTSFRSAACCSAIPDLVQPEFEGGPRVYDEREVQVLDFSRGEDINFVYGDDWHHLVEFEQLLVVEPAPRVARCVDGARARPPEDVGGPHGYAE